MSEHLLNDAQISPASEEMRREAMPEKVGIDVGFKSCARSVAL